MKWNPEEVQAKGIKYFLDQIRAMPKEEAAEEYYEFAMGARQDPMYDQHPEFHKAVEEMIASAVALKMAVDEKNKVEMAGAQAEAELILAKDTLMDTLRESRKRLVQSYIANPDTPGLKELLDELMEKEKKQGRFNPEDWEGFV